MNPDAPLTGITVLDLSNTLMGPFCSLQLAHAGADVIKVEEPAGDITRTIGQGRHPGMGPIFLNANHGKRSIAIDLKEEAGQAVLLALVRRCDVLIHNFRPTAVTKLGLDYPRLRAVNERLISCAVIGFGSTGPYRDKAAYDDVIQAISGVAAAQGGADGPPQYVRATIADKVVGLLAFGAITAALLQRERTGTGQAVEVPMFEAMAGFTALELQGGHIFDPPTGPAGYARLSTPYRRPYRTTDGYLGVVVYTDRQWLAFFDLIGEPELSQDPRFATIAARTQHIDQLYQLVERALASDTSAHWLARLDELGIPAVAVKRVDDLVSDPHLDAVDFFQRVRHPTEGGLRIARSAISFGGNPPPELPGAPRLSEHAYQVLAESGFTDDQIRQLAESGTIRLPDEEVHE